MGLKELEEKVREDFEQDLETLREQARLEIESINSEIEEQAREKAEHIISQGKRVAEIEYKSTVSDAKSKLEKDLLKKKDEAIESVLSEVADRIPSWDDDSKKAIMSKLVGDLSRLGDYPTIKVAPEYAYLLPQGINVNVIQEDIGGFGVIMYSQNGNAHIDNRIKNYINGNKSKLKGFVSKILFG